MVTLGAFMLVLGVMRGLPGGGTGLPPGSSASVDTTLFVAQLAIMLAAATYSLRSRSRSLRLSLLYKACVFLTVIAITLALGFSDLIGQAWLLASMGMCGSIVELCTWVLLIDVARRYERPVAYTVALGRLVVHAALGAGTLLALLLGEWSSVLLAVSSMVIVADGLFLIEAGQGDVPAAALFDIDISPEAFVEGTPRELGQGERADAERFSSEHGLSTRESEIFALWITSHGIKQIMAELDLSEATVKTHIRHIYAKCDVHSRRELVEAIERA